MAQRHSDNPNLSLVYGSSYRELPIIELYTPMFSQYLDIAHNVLFSALKDHTRIAAFRVDLMQDIDATPEDALELLIRDVREFKKKLQQDEHKELHKQITQLKSARRRKVDPIESGLLARRLTAELTTLKHVAETRLIELCRYHVVHGGVQPLTVDQEKQAMALYQQKSACEPELAGENAFENVDDSKEQVELAPNAARIIEGLPEDFLAECCTVSPQGQLNEVVLSNCVQRICDRDGVGGGMPLSIQQLQRLLQSYKAKVVEVRVRDSNT